MEYLVVGTKDEGRKRLNLTFGPRDCSFLTAPGEDKGFILQGFRVTVSPGENDK